MNFSSVVAIHICILKNSGIITELSTLSSLRYSHPTSGKRRIGPKAEKHSYWNNLERTLKGWQDVNLNYHNNQTLTFGGVIHTEVSDEVKLAVLCNSNHAL